MYTQAESDYNSQGLEYKDRDNHSEYFSNSILVVQTYNEGDFQDSYYPDERNF